jgi:hypothetical protein
MADKSIQCRHNLDPRKIGALSRLLYNLPKVAPSVVKEGGIAPDEYDLYFRSSIESIRGTFSATGMDKRKFFNAILSAMQDAGVLRSWNFIGTEGRQDYRLVLGNKKAVCIEAKGCPDGNNTTIWERPSWAEEFIVWCQCPDSLHHQPGHGVWSGISTRLMPTIIMNKAMVDAFVFFDGRCGSSMRPCKKAFGIEGNLRSKATDIPGEGGRKWLPPPSIYLFPRTMPHPHSNPTPKLHDLKSCRFADALLEFFKVPKEKRPEYLNWANVEVKGDVAGTHINVKVGFGLNNKKPVVESGFKILKRER